MNCDVFRILISGHMDGANSEIEEKRLQEHLKGCRSCRALLAEDERNDRLLSEVPSPPENLTGRIMREIVPRRKKKKAKFIYFTVPAAAPLRMLWRRLRRQPPLKRRRRPKLSGSRYLRM